MGKKIKKTLLLEIDGLFFSCQTECDSALEARTVLYWGFNLIQGKTLFVTKYEEKWCVWTHISERMFNQFKKVKKLYKVISDSRTRLQVSVVFAEAIKREEEAINRNI